MSYEDFSIEAYLEDWTQFDSYDDKVRLLAELARLRRVEDAYRKDNLRIDGHTGEQWCERCERWCELSRTLIHASDCDVAIHLNLPREKGEGRGGVSLKSFITESIGILRSNSGPECAMAVDQIEQSVTKEFARLERYYELLEEAAEKWAEGCIYKTFNPETVADFACTHCDRKGDPIEHTADCKAARILGLKREGEG